MRSHHVSCQRRGEWRCALVCLCWSVKESNSTVCKKTPKKWERTNRTRRKLEAVCNLSLCVCVCASNSESIHVIYLHLREFILMYVRVFMGCLCVCVWFCGSVCLWQGVNEDLTHPSPTGGRGYRQQIMGGGWQDSENGGLLLQPHCGGTTSSSLTLKRHRGENVLLSESNNHWHFFLYISIHVCYVSIYNTVIWAIFLSLWFVSCLSFFVHEPPVKMSHGRRHFDWGN